VLWNRHECGKNQGDENLKANISNAYYDRSKTAGNLEYLNYWCSMITKDAINIHEIKSRTAMTKATFNKKKTLFTSKLDLNLRRKLDLEYSFVWCWGRMEIS
jgi:hypothetical protein